MELENFIQQEVKMLMQGFDKSQIKEDVYRYVFSKGIANIRIDSLIMSCMDVYAKIILLYNGNPSSKNN